MIDLLARLQSGLVIPAHPLALNAQRKLDERRQRALTRYYVDAGAGGVAVGVHTTQFAIREPKHGLLGPVLELAAEETKGREVLRVAGVCGETSQAVKEATLARDLGYHAGLLSLSAFRNAPVATLIDHARAVGEVIPLFGFYLQPAVGGRLLSVDFWREFASLPAVVAIKVAPFNRYQTLDVLRGVAESGRAAEIALYTGNDDNILLDLATHFRISSVDLKFTGGLLGHWAVWTRRAVEHLALAKQQNGSATDSFLRLATEVTDSNAALFDAANAFAGCIAGIHEILRRQGLLEGIWCLDPAEGLSPGQSAELDRVVSAYPHLVDDSFVREHLDRWLN